MHTRMGSFVAIVGPDGVGKTTLAKHLLNQAGHPTGYVHFRPSLFRALPPKPQSTTVASPEKHPPKQVVLGWLRLTASILRFWTGYLARIVPLLRKGGTVVADRWGYGYLAQPNALRFFGPPGLARLAVRIIPKPDLIINLVAPPSLIANRKAELTIEEIRTELELWTRLPVESIVTLDATLPPEDLASHILCELKSIKR